MRWALFAGSSLVLFLSAAKAHGRELRLERLAAGFDHVIFGGDNPAFIDALWRAERVRFWIAAPALAAALLALLKTRGIATGPAALGAVVWASALAFAGCGIASLVRAGAAREGIGGSVGWWTAVAAAGVLTALATRGVFAAR
jgi:hypothetical protein